jgi:hypothetical protein
MGGAFAERPVEFAIGFADGHVVDAGFAAAHEAVLVELPLLVAVSAEPVAGVVVEFILEADGDAVLVEGPELLDEAVVELVGPLAAEEVDDGGASLKKLGAVAPAGVLGIGEGDALGIARVPGVLKGGSGGRGSGMGVSHGTQEGEDDCARHDDATDPGEHVTMAGVEG